MVRAKKHITRLLAVVLVGSTLLMSNSADASWRSTKSKTIKESGKNYTLTAKADLPYWSDSNGGGAWKSQAKYTGPKKKLTNAWSFYSIGGSVSWQGMGLQGDGTSTGSSYAYKDSSVNANGYVYGTGLAIYVGMIATASFSKGNTYYSISTKI